MSPLWSRGNVSVTGAFLLVYITWVLATSFHVTHFLTGTLVFTYSVTGLGILLFVTGFIGWVATTSEKICALKLYLSMLIIAVCCQIGGIVTLTAFGTEMNDILRKGWFEVNQATRSLVEVNMNCCGFFGPQEFTDTANVIAESCYVPSSSSTGDDKYLKPDGCGNFLKHWFERNKVVWCSVLAVLGGIQLMCIVICAHIIHKLRDKSIYSSPSSSTKNLSNSQYI